MPQIDLQWVDLPVDVHADTDGHSQIRIHRRLLQVARRCAVDHELAHIELGHTCGADERQEVAARKLSARRLIKIDELSDAARWTVEMSELADTLWVTEDVLTTRLRHLHPAERHLLLRATAHHRGEDQ